MEEFFLEHEEAFDEGHRVVLFNTKEAGTISLTNFRLLFVSKDTKCVVELGTIPLTAIEKLNDVPSWALKKLLPPEHSMLEVTGHDARVLVFIYKDNNEELKKMFDTLKKCIKPVHLEHIYAFSSKSRTDKASSSAMRLLKEYHRLFQKWFAHSPSTCFEAQVNLQNKWFRVSEINFNYGICETYPAWLIVPNNISDEELWVAATSRIKNRFPAISWFDSGSGAVLARSSQPKFLTLTTPEKLVLALRTPCIHHTDKPRKLCIVDLRPIANTLANMSAGGGSELSHVYSNSEICQSAVDNIHVMTSCFHDLREYVDGYGSLSSDGEPLHKRECVQARTPKSLTDISKLQTWLGHIHSILACASYITTKIAGDSASVLVHCSDGWDRTSQLIGLSCILLDPFYRTFSGFQALVEKDWLGFGHNFAARMGLPNIMGSEGRPKYKLPWDDPASSLKSTESSPVFLQWLECIAHLLGMYPCAFEFSSKFLVDFMDAVLSCRFGNFLCNSERDREQADVASCLCVWEYLADLRASDTLHEHRNPLYDPQRHHGPIVPPAPALVPTLWPQFYLRWSCSLESHGGVAGFQGLIKEIMSAQTVEETESLRVDENQPDSGMPIRVVASNVKKL